MYLFDTNIFRSLSVFYPESFSAVWDKLNHLASKGGLISVREVYLELIRNCPEQHIEKWATSHKKIFVVPNNTELEYVSRLLKTEENRNLLRHENIIKGLPVADPFIIAVAKNRGATVVTQEIRRLGAKIPNVCTKEKISCCSLRDFFNAEKIKYK